LSDTGINLSFILFIFETFLEKWEAAIYLENQKNSE
jgi:hypothetical protein